MSEDVFRKLIATGVFLSFIAVVVQTALLFVVCRRVKVTQIKVLRVVNAVLAVIGIIHRFVEENAPKFFEIETHASKGAKSLKEQANRLGDVFKDLTDHLCAKVAWIVGAMDQTLQQANQASNVVNETILILVKQVDGIMHGIRKALSVLSHSRGQRPPMLRKTK